MDRFFKRLLVILGIVLVVFECALALIFRNYVMEGIREDCIHQLSEAKTDLDATFSPQEIYDQIDIDTAFLVRIRAGLNYGFGSTVAESKSIVNTTHFLTSAKNSKSSAVHSIYVVLLDDDSPYMLTDSGLVSRKYMNDTLWQKTYQNCRYGDFCEFRILPTAKGDGQAPASVVTVYHHIVSRHWDTGELIEGCIIVNYYLQPPMLQLKRIAPFADKIYLYDTLNNEFQMTDNSSALPDPTIPAIIQDGQQSGTIPERSQVYFHECSDVLPLGYLLVCSESKIFRLPNMLALTLGLAAGMIVACFALFYAIFFQQNRKYRHNIQNFLEISGEHTISVPLGILPSDHGKKTQEYLMSQKLSKREMRSLLQNEKNMRLEMEMLALQSQINPHFLLNTVDFLYWKQVGESGFFSEQTSMMENLCKILKYALDSSAIMVPLRDELEHAKAYLEIQDKRKGQKADVIMEIPAELEDALVMKLLLQPILENCYKYGMASDTNRPMTITVRVWKAGDDLLLNVIDTGSGMPDALIAKVNEELVEGTRHSRHIGLSNINRRLQLYYGEGCGLTLSHSEGGGLTVTARMRCLRS